MDYVTLRNRAENYDTNILRMICKSNAHSPPFLLGSNLAANCCLLISFFNAVSCHGHSAISTSSAATPPSSVADAAAKSVQSGPTLCNPRDGSPPGSPIPGILQAIVELYLEFLGKAYFESRSEIYTFLIFILVPYF